MSDDETLPNGSGGAAHVALPARRMSASEELTELRGVTIEAKLGYFGSEDLVIFGYCPGGGEVVWKDGRSSGFGTGGWAIFLQEIVPLAARRGADLGGMSRVGTHVLLMNRSGGKIYVVRREAAEGFLAEACGVPPPTRRCLCALDCASCPMRGCAAMMR